MPNSLRDTISRLISEVKLLEKRVEGLEVAGKVVDDTD